MQELGIESQAPGTLSSWPCLHSLLNACMESGILMLKLEIYWKKHLNLLELSRPEQELEPSQLAQELSNLIEEEKKFNRLIRNL